MIITMFRSWEELSLAKEHYTSFLIVRDPLDRLISCYRDKMVRNVIKSSKMQEKPNEKTNSNVFTSLIQLSCDRITRNYKPEAARTGSPGRRTSLKRFNKSWKCHKLETAGQ